MDIYTLSRNYWDYAFNNPEKIKPNHSAVYFFAIEHCNRLGWKNKFGFPTTMVMEAVGIKSYNTYISALNDLVNFGFIKMIEKSTNQYSANIIAISKYNKAHDKALDKAFIKHTTKQNESTQQSIDSIDIQIYNNTNIQDSTPKGESKPKSFKTLTKEEFYEQLKAFVGKYEKSTVRDFYDYWTEPSASGIMKFQLCQTWDNSRRLSTWKKNESQFSNKPKATNTNQEISGPWAS